MKNKLFISLVVIITMVLIIFVCGYANQQQTSKTDDTESIQETFVSSLSGENRETENTKEKVSPHLSNENEVSESIMETFSPSSSTNKEENSKAQKHSDSALPLEESVIEDGGWLGFTYYSINDEAVMNSVEYNRKNPPKIKVSENELPRFTALDYNSDNLINKEDFLLSKQSESEFAKRLIELRYYGKIDDAMKLIQGEYEIYYNG